MGLGKLNSRAGSKGPYKVSSPTSGQSARELPAVRKPSRRDSETTPQGWPMVFARHETFHPRYGWIKKGFDAAQLDPLAFQRDDSPVALGVGKNMVRAIRYWCTAFKVLAEHEGKTRGLVPTEFGRRLLSDGGFDPYLEDLGSLWLLHWNLLLQPCAASAWGFAFGLFPAAEFTTDDLIHGIEAWVNKEAPTSRIVQASFRKDAHCILRMYSESEDPRLVSEESIHCPFVELGLIRPLPGQRRAYSFSIGAKQGLTSELIAATCLDFAGTQSPTARSIAFSRLLRDPTGPGRVFRLTEGALHEALEDAATLDQRLRVSDSAGLLQLSYTEDPREMSLEFVERHFGRKARRRIPA